MLEMMAGMVETNLKDYIYVVAYREQTSDPIAFYHCNLKAINDAEAYDLGWTIMTLKHGLTTCVNDYVFEGIATGV